MFSTSNEDIGILFFVFIMKNTSWKISFFLTNWCVSLLWDLQKPIQIPGCAMTSQSLIHMDPQRILVFPTILRLSATILSLLQDHPGAGYLTRCWESRYTLESLALPYILPRWLLLWWRISGRCLRLETATNLSREWTQVTLLLRHRWSCSVSEKQNRRG